MIKTETSLRHLRRVRLISACSAWPGLCSINSFAIPSSLTNSGRDFATGARVLRRLDPRQPIGQPASRPPLSCPGRIHVGVGFMRRQHRADAHFLPIWSPRAGTFAPSSESCANPATAHLPIIGFADDADDAEAKLPAAGGRPERRWWWLTLRSLRIWSSSSNGHCRSSNGHAISATLPNKVVAQLPPDEHNLVTHVCDDSVGFFR